MIRCLVVGLAAVAACGRQSFDVAFSSHTPATALTSTDGVLPRLAVSNGQLGLSWLGPAGCLVYFMPLDGDGLPMAPERQISDAAASCNANSITPTTDGFALLWRPTTGTGAVLSRVGTDGGDLLADTTVIAINTYATLVSSGSELAMIGLGTGNISQLVRIDPAGALLGTATALFMTVGINLTWTGTMYGAAGCDQQQVLAGFLDAGGARIGGDLLVNNLVNAPQTPAIAGTGDQIAIAWTRDVDGDYEIFYNEVSVDGTLLTETPRFTTATERSILPTIAASQDGYVLAWHDERAGNPEIYAARVEHGVKIGGDYRVTDDRRTSTAPAIAWTGDKAVVVWRDDRDGAMKLYSSVLVP